MCKAHVGIFVQKNIFEATLADSTRTQHAVAFSSLREKLLAAFNRGLAMSNGVSRGRLLNDDDVYTIPRCAQCSARSQWSINVHCTLLSFAILLQRLKLLSQHKIFIPFHLRIFYLISLALLTMLVQKSLSWKHIDSDSHNILIHVNNNIIGEFTKWKTNRLCSTNAFCFLSCSWVFAP